MSESFLGSLPDWLRPVEEAAAESLTLPPDPRPRDRRPVVRMPRFNVQLAAEFGTKEPLAQTGIALNVSRTGLALATETGPDVGARLWVRLLDAPAPPARLFGQVVWVRPLVHQDRTLSAFGLRIQQADPPYLGLLARVSGAPQ